MADERNVHWNGVYSTKSADTVSWYQPQPQASLDAIARTGAPRDTAVIDVGGGASTLVDRLAAEGWSDLTVMDISQAALDVTRARLGTAAAAVDWIAADAASWIPPRAYGLWHDRAVFHFLTDPADRAGYRRALAAGLEPGGLLIIATFAPDGPERCSGLPVQRYDAEGLAAELGPDFERLEAWREEHTTPWGSIQPFTWAVFRRRA